MYAIGFWMYLEVCKSIISYNGEWACIIHLDLKMNEIKSTRLRLWPINL